MNSKDIKFNDRVYIENKVLRRRLRVLYTNNKVFYKFVRNNCHKSVVFKKLLCF
jgi:hypothetical protein